MTEKVWLEVALNGPWTKQRQPNIPTHPDDIIDEAIKCVKQGASIIHYHGYDDKTGKESFAIDLHIYIIQSILSEVDAIVYPGIQTLNEKDALSTKALDHRYEHIPLLAKLDLMEWMVVDPGTAHLSMIDKPNDKDNSFIYINSNESIKAGMDIANEYSIHPSFAIYEPGFIRLGNAMDKAYGKSTNPIYRFMFSDQLSFGYPPTEVALNSYIELLKSVDKDASWMVAGLGVEIDSIIQKTIVHGGHIRTGLEDYLLGTRETNYSLTERTVDTIVKHGGELASPSEIRSTLKSKENK